MDAKPLDGMKVIDLTHVLAGPYCTYQLGLLGAEVVKIESPKGDMVRSWGGTENQLAHKLGSGFVSQNAGKRSICLDITEAEGADIVKSLASGADIMVENYRPGALASYGLGYDDIVALNPDIIYVSISAFGQNGPHGHRPGFDDVVQATSGFMSVNIRGDGPIRTGGPVLDYATGMQATSAVLAATLLRLKTGKGQRIDIAMQDVTMLLLNRNTSITASTGIPPEAAGNRDAPMLGRFRAKEGYVMLAGYLPHHCRSLCVAMGLDEYANLDNREFATRGKEIEQAVEHKMLERTAAKWDEIFSKAGVVGGGVRNLAEVLNTGQPASRELLSTVGSAAGEFQVTNNGYRINDEVFTPRSGVPTLGQHTREVLEEIGYETTQIDSLLESGVIKG
jgi:crotonobetainyl-CoA:carnitine CoA-transferase CaiB-like acyl-CoA transferase